MLKGTEFGAAIGKAIQLKLDAGFAKSKAEIARHFNVKPPSLVDWVKKGSVAKDKLPELWRYFSDVAGPSHWGMTPAEWPAGLTQPLSDEAMSEIGLQPPSNTQNANAGAESAVMGAPEQHLAQLRSDAVIVKVFDARASMGLGLAQPEHDTVVDHIRLTKGWVRTHLPTISGPDSLAVLSAYGDSMSPTFADGDILLVDRGVHDIKVDAVYVLALNNELYIKRIQRRITDGAVIIKSDNPLYDPVVVENGERDGLRVLGRVVWAWNGRKL